MREIENPDEWEVDAMMAERAKPTVKLVGADGNVFNVIGLVSRALRGAGQPERAKEFVDRAMSSGSYDAVLALAFDYCEVE